MIVKPTGCTCLIHRNTAGESRLIHDPTCIIHNGANRPDDMRVVVLLCGDPTNDVDRSCGITYQKCGGGRRVIKKRIGGN